MFDVDSNRRNPHSGPSGLAGTRAHYSLACKDLHEKLLINIFARNNYALVAATRRGSSGLRGQRVAGWRSLIHGLAGVLGFISSTGIAGLTLGGGFGS